MKFCLSSRSLEKLEGLHPDLIKVVMRAIEITSIDFGVTQGVRSIEDQASYFVKGASQRLVSRHMTGHAVDVQAYIGGNRIMTAEPYFTIADAFLKAGNEYGISLEWGGAFGLELNKFKSAKDAWRTYQAIRIGRKKFFDGFHFNLTDKAYPADKIKEAEIAGLIQDAILEIRTRV